MITKQNTPSAKPLSWLPTSGLNWPTDSPENLPPTPTTSCLTWMMKRRKRWRVARVCPSLIQMTKSLVLMPKKLVLMILKLRPQQFKETWKRKQTLPLPVALTGAHSALLLPSRTRPIAVPAGLSPPLLNLKVSTKSRLVPLKTCLNKMLLTAPYMATVAAMVAPCGMCIQPTLTLKA